MRLTRRASLRTLTQTALALALAPWAHAIQAPAAGRRWRHNPFALGVACGRPEPQALVLWTRLLVQEEDRQSVGDDPLTVTLEVFADEGLRRRVHTQTLATNAARAHSVHAVVSGLRPATDYWYRFRQGTAQSRVGHARTAPAPEASVRALRFALASCQHYEQGQYTAHEAMAGEDLDFVLFVGDYIYENSNAQYALRPHNLPEAVTLAQYRERYALYKRDPFLQASHAAHPWVLMWDDHEVVNDYANDQDMRHTDPARVLQRRAAAYQAYFEHQPLRIGPEPHAPAHMRLHAQFPWGRLAEIWTLDCRQYRSPQACRDPVRGGGRMITQCDERLAPERSMLGAAQEDWLSGGLRASTRPWQLLAQSTQISSTRIPAPIDWAYWNDAWDGYPEARRRLLQTVHDLGRRSVVTLGGDVHMNVAANLRLEPNDPNAPIVASEFVTTSITSRGMGERALNLIRESNPDIRHARADERGYSRFLLTADQLRCDFQTTAFPAGSQAGFRTQASFGVLRDQPGVRSL